MNLVFFDIDGTLAEGTEVPLSTQKAIRQLRHKGSLVWICTGRPLSYAKRNFHMYANGYIVLNGREAYTCCEKLFSHPLEMDQIQIIQEKCNAVDVGYCFYDNQRGYFFGNEEGYDWIQNAYGGELVRNANLNEHPVYNMDIWFKDEETFTRLQEQTKDLLILNRHGSYPTCDATILPYHKGTAIQHVAQFLNVPFENTYAFGDGVNDLMMFEAVRHTVAMGNGDSLLKEKAEFVTTNIDEDGIWNGCQHFNLL